jgi:ribosome-associated heat shock protein Hsp15
VKVGDMLRIRTEGGEFLVEVAGLSEMRGPAAAAQTLYRETDQSREARIKAAEERKMMMQMEGPPPGKPSKRDRRWKDRLRGNYR